MGDISKNIREIRTRQNLTQDELAERIHTTRQTISNYETGRSRPDIDTLELLAEALECDTEMLLYGKARPVPDPRQVRRLVIGLCLLAGLFLAQFAVSLLAAPDIDRYQIRPLALLLLYQLRYARTLLLGWCAAQGLTALRLLPTHPCRWLRTALWGVLALWPLYCLLSFAFSGQAPLWLTTVTRLLLRLHLWPGYFAGGALAFCLGASIRLTEKV